MACFMESAIRVCKIRLSCQPPSTLESSIAVPRTARMWRELCVVWEQYGVSPNNTEGASTMSGNNDKCRSTLEQTHQSICDRTTQCLRTASTCEELLSIEFSGKLQQITAVRYGDSGINPTIVFCRRIERIVPLASKIFCQSMMMYLSRCKEE